MPRIRPPPTSHDITDHSDDTPVTPATPTVKPAKPFLLARMTFSIGTGEHRYCLFLCIAKPEQFPAAYRTGFNVNDLMAIPRWKCSVFGPPSGCGCGSLGLLRLKSNVFCPFLSAIVTGSVSCHFPAV